MVAAQVNLDPCAGPPPHAPPCPTLRKRHVCDIGPDCFHTLSWSNTDPLQTSSSIEMKFTSITAALTLLLAGASALEKPLDIEVQHSTECSRKTKRGPVKSISSCFI